MRKYETVFISDPDLQDQSRKELFDKVRNIITRENGILLDFDEWGNKKLAYAIKKKFHGHYVCITYGGSGKLIKELERNLRLSDEVLKFMTLLLSDDVTLEQLEKEAEQAQKQPEKSEKDDRPEEEPVGEKASDTTASDKEETVEENKKETENI